jgi:hypothetical protein
MPLQPLVGEGLLAVEVLRSFSDTPHSVGFLWPVDQPDRERRLPDNTQHSQKKGIDAPGGIRTHNPRKGAAANPCHRPSVATGISSISYYEYLKIQFLSSKKITLSQTVTQCYFVIIRPVDQETSYRNIISESQSTSLSETPI